jgi:hypothetical protein
MEEEAEGRVPASEMYAPLPSRPLWRHPIVMGLVGIALLVGGWKLSSYVPEVQRGGLLEGLKRQAEEQEDEGTQGLADRLHRWPTRGHREPPFRLAGQLVLLAGLVLFVAAGMRMWRERAGNHPEDVTRDGRAEHSLD